MAEATVVLYWDTSAVLSYLFVDSHSAIAHNWAATDGHHLLSSLAHAEACAVIARMTREGIIDESDANAAQATVQNGWWRELNGLPDRDTVSLLAEKWTLRGADLWHLAMAVSLREELSELTLISFDDRLSKAATGEGLAYNG
jgi:predicted nucleic acid-binding protein